MSQFLEAVLKIEEAYERILHDLHRQLADHLRQQQEEKSKMGGEPTTSPAWANYVREQQEVHPEYVDGDLPNTKADQLDENGRVSLAARRAARKALDDWSGEIQARAIAKALEERPFFHHRSCALRKGGDICTC